MKPHAVHHMSRTPAVTMMFLLLISYVTYDWPATPKSLDEDPDRMEQFGGGSTFEAQCSKSSFEDVFTYTWAEFNVSVASNWRSAQIEAVAWVNGTMADDFRIFLDDLLARFIPSGGDGWLSSDEREAVRAVAADCVEYTMTRVGVRDGVHHRGGPAVDWRNATWVEDGVSIDEWNMVPENHESVRSCTNIGSSQNCYEVPVEPSQSRDCDTNNELQDECRIELMLSGTVDLHNIESVETLTLAMNVSNISRATYTVNAPFVDGMRLALFEECEGRDLLTGKSPTPLRGSCIGDGSSKASHHYDDQGAMVLNIEPNRSSSFWPSGEDLFFDLTTISPPVDQAPIWSSTSPSEGTIWAYSSNSKYVDSAGLNIADWSDVSSWFIDEGPVSSLEINCFLEEDSDINMVSDSRTIIANIDEEAMSTSFMCSAEDISGQSTGFRNFTALNVISFSRPDGFNEIHDNIELIFRNTSIPEFYHAKIADLEVRVGVSSPFGEPIFFDNPIVLHESAESQNFTGELSFLPPGVVETWLDFSGPGFYERIEMLDLELYKVGDPPVLSVLESGWTDTSWQMRGVFSEPDGEKVSFTMFIDGINMGSVQSTGNTWSVGPVNFELFEIGPHTISVRACDESGLCSFIDMEIDSTLPLAKDGHEYDAPDDTDGGGGMLPFPVYSSMWGIVAAAFIYGKGRREGI